MLGQFYVPKEDILRELGRMQVLHSQLDHMLRLVIKRTLGISIDDAGYWNETRGMAKTLRERARALIGTSKCLRPNRAYSTGPRCPYTVTRVVRQVPFNVDRRVAR